MNTADYIVIAVLALIVIGAIFAIYRCKKSGKKCIGCPDAGNCSGGCCGCKQN